MSIEKLLKWYKHNFFRITVAVVGTVLFIIFANNTRLLPHGDIGKTIGVITMLTPLLFFPEVIIYWKKFKAYWDKL